MFCMDKEDTDEHKAPNRDAKKLDKVTTFKLTEDMTAELDVVMARWECTKDASIRRLLRYGLKVFAEMEKMTDIAAARVALKEPHETRDESARLKAVNHSQKHKRGHHR